MKAKSKTTLIVLVAIMACIGLVFATNGWFQYIYEYTPIEGEYLEQTDTFTISESPDVPQYVNASMTIVGSGFLSHPHEWYVNVSHTKPDPNESSYWTLECQVRAFLKESDETIAAYTITNLGGDGFDLNFGTWIPVSPPFPYTITLNVTDYVWTNTERGNATYSAENIVKTITSTGGTAGTLGAISLSGEPGTLVEYAEIPIGSEMGIRFEYSSDTVNPTSCEYKIIDGGVTVIDWTPVPQYSTSLLAHSVYWTVTGTPGPRQLEVCLHTVLP